jgi:hypothetical protein
MGVKETIKSQYDASLEMLKQAIVKCPESRWANQEDKNKFWHVAYHALFYTHLYLQPSGGDFTPWAKHRPEHEFLGPVPWPPHKQPEIGEPYSKEEILEYHQVCCQQVEEQVSSLNLDAESGFDWLPFNKMELQFYNIRHLQHHTGELCERLGAREKIDVDWVGRGPKGT